MSINPPEAVVPQLPDIGKCGEIARLEAELGHLRTKRRGLETAIEFRVAKLNRLKAQRVMDAPTATALPQTACCG
jgi:hypothetical protein